MQLMVSRSLMLPADECGVRATLARGSIWRPQAPDRLVIEFRRRAQLGTSIVSTYCTHVFAACIVP